MKKNELTIGNEYAVNVSTGRRWSLNKRGVYLGDAPWLFGGSTRASLHAIRKDAEGLEVDADGNHTFTERQGYAPLRLRGAVDRTYKGEAWLLAPNTTHWSQQSPFGRGNAKRGLFALVDDDGNVYRWEVIAYGVRIERTWEREGEIQAEIKATRAQVDAQRQLARDYDYALVTRAIEIIDERGLTAQGNEDPVYYILGSRRNSIATEAEHFTGNLVGKARAFLLGAGELDSSDI